MTAALVAIEPTECTQLTLLPMPPSQPPLLTAEELDQALEVVQVAAEQVERLHAVANANRIRALARWAVQAMEKARVDAEQAAQGGSKGQEAIWRLQRATQAAKAAATEVRQLTRTYTSQMARIAKRTGQEG